MATILVTGSESGLGLAIAERLIADGHSVIRFDEKFGDDVRWPQNTPFPETQIDVLINCAGVNGINWLEDVEFSEFMEMIAVNTWGAAAMTKKLIEDGLFSTNPSVLNIISDASHRPMRASAAYNASKGALHIMTLQMARELYDRHGITVFGVSPNKLKGTGMSSQIDNDVQRVRGWTPEQAYEYQVSGLATKQETDPAQLADFISYLFQSKDNHKYFHGCVIPYGA